MHTGGWWRFVQYNEKDKSQISIPLLKRVASFARPYTSLLALLLGTILVDALIGLVPPLVYRGIIDDAIGKTD
ncbi:MAG: ABC transporter ATP-binding protein, partial [Chloroflexi bacterium]|nr:ABC transporter ATP-binding protein [Chloroflexota bacterium]